MIEDVIRDLRERGGKGHTISLEIPKKSDERRIIYAIQRKAGKNDAKEAFHVILASMAAYALDRGIQIELGDKELQKIYERYRRILKGHSPSEIRELADTFKRIQRRVLENTHRQAVSKIKKMINELSQFADMDLYKFQAEEAKDNIKATAQAIKKYVDADLLSFGAEHTFSVSMALIDDDLLKVLGVNPDAPSENIYNRIFWEHERHHLTYSSAVRDEIYAIHQEIKKIEDILKRAKNGDKKAQYLTAHALYALKTLMKSFERLKEMNEKGVSNVEEVKYHITHAVLPTMFDRVPSKDELLAALPVIEERLIEKYPSLKNAIQRAMGEIKRYA